MTQDYYRSRWFRLIFKLLMATALIIIWGSIAGWHSISFWNVLVTTLLSTESVDQVADRTKAKKEAQKP